MAASNKKIRVVSAAVVREGKYLITQRTARAVLPNLWEFPGGKVEAGEDDKLALARELEYRVGVKARVGELISTTEREYADYVVELKLYRCDIGKAEPKPVTVQAVRWVTSDEFEDFEFTPAD